MGDDIGSSSVMGCCLRSFGDHRQQTELHYVGWAKYKNKQNPEPMSSPINYPAYIRRNHVVRDCVWETKLGVTFNFDKQDVIDFTKISKMTVCRVSEPDS